jgi:hypothetical protein
VPLPVCGVAGKPSLNVYLIVEHLLKVRHVPLPICGVAGKPSRDVVVYSSPGASTHHD